MINSAKPSHFPNLDILRFYAALSVVMWHTNYWLHGMLDEASMGWLSGWDGVTLFFVLSGFLITYLLMKERRETGQIDVRAFYMRRILRIWPLYFLIVFLATVVLGGQFTSAKDLILVLLLLPNFTSSVPMGMIQLWSIGVEEQFYGLYPLLFRRFNLVRLSFFVILLRWELMTIINLPQFIIYGDLGGIRQWLSFARFDAFAIGALFAYMLARNHRRLNLFYKAFPVLGITFLVAMIFPTNAVGNALYDTAFAVLCGGIIVNVIRYPIFENRWTRLGGNISYGIYMYHMAILSVLPLSLIESRISVLITLAVAALSYRFFETPFLRLKERWRQREHLAAQQSVTA